MSNALEQLLPLIPRAESERLMTAWTRQEGEEALYQLEQIIMNGAHKAREGMLQVHLALHIILENQLWLYIRDADGKPVFQHQDDYLRDLADRCGLARSTIFAYRATLKIATKGLGMDLEKVAQVGLRPFDILRRHLIYDRSDGRILGFRHTSDNLPQGEEATQLAKQLLEEVIECHNAEMPPREIHRFITEKLGDKPLEIVFWLVPSAKGGYELGYTYNNMRKLLSEPDVPQEVIEKLTEKLRIVS